MFFFFYFIPFLTCTAAGILFFTKEDRNIAAGLLFVILGLVPIFNILGSFAAIIFLLVHASTNKGGNREPKQVYKVG